MNDRQIGRIEGYIKGLNFAMGVIQAYSNTLYPEINPQPRKILQDLENQIHAEYVRITK